MESRVDPRAPVRRTRAAVAARDPTARVVDVRGEPVEGATVRVFVGDWRTETVPLSGTQERETTAAYVQSPGVTGQTGGDGVVTFPRIEDWGLRSSIEDRQRPTGPPVKPQVPAPVDPEITNPYALLVAEYDGPDGTWFGARRARYYRLTGVREPPVSGDEPQLAPPEITLERRRLGHDRFGTPVGGLGSVTAWQAVRDPAADPGDPRRYHRLAVEVRAQRPEGFLRDGTDDATFHTSDFVDQGAAQSWVGGVDEDAQHPLLHGGSVGIAIPQDGMVPAIGGSEDPTAARATVEPLVDDPRADGPFSLAMATAGELDRGDWPFPVYPLVRPAFHRYGHHDPDRPDAIANALGFGKSLVKGLIGDRIGTVGVIFSALNIVSQIDAAIDSQQSVETGRQIGSARRDPNVHDEVRTGWDRETNVITEADGGVYGTSESPFAVVHRVPVRFVDDGSGTDTRDVVFSGSWAAGLEDDPPDRRQHRLRMRGTVVDRVSPLEGGE